MRKSSQIALWSCFVLAALLTAAFVHYRNVNKPQMTEADARVMLQGLAKAFENESTGKVLDFASPNAKVAGRNLERIRDLLGRAFAFIKNGHVEFRDVKYSRDSDRVSLATHAHVVDRPDGQTSGGETLYSQPVNFVLKPVDTPQFLGLLSSRTWKIVDVDARGLPD